MTNGLAEESITTAPILVLGLGNVRLGDDGLGPRLVSELALHYKSIGWLEFVDGGTQGLSLLSCLCHRKAVVILVSLARGDKPGSVCILGTDDILHRRPGRAASTRAGNLGELLLAAAVLEDLPDQVLILGVEPAQSNTGNELSQEVHRSLPTVVSMAENIIESLLSELGACVAA